MAAVQRLPPDLGHSVDRRAARHGKLLGVNEPFLYQVVDTVIHENECQYPDLREKQSYITKVIRTEEENFARTIDGGMRIYGEMLAAHKEKGETVFSGSDAFKLYDTFGFPIDLTAEMAAEEGMTVDETAFQTLMTEQKERAREARKALGDLGWAGVEFGKDMPATVFAGYEYDKLDDANVLAIVTDGQLVEEIVSGMDAIVVLDQTPFYAEMGGQVADHGVITADGVEFVVTDVQKNKGGKYMHYGKLLRGALHVGDSVSPAIDTERRSAVRRAHTATHLLDAALKKVLGDHVHQAGSLVEPDRLRFDFTHFEAITPEQLLQVEDLVNDAVLDGLSVITEELPLAEAKARGAVATFGEKYGETVRVVTMGEFSMELCGGTHLDNTAKAGMFRIKSESSVASGVRRIEATTGKVSLEETRHGRTTLLKAAQFFKTAPSSILERMEQQANEMKELRQAVEKFKAEASLGEAKQVMASAKAVGGLHIITSTRQGLDANALRTMGDFLRDKDPVVVAVLATLVVAEDALLFLVLRTDGFMLGPILISAERNYAENLLFLAGALLAIGYAVRSLALRFEKPPADESDERAARIGDNLLIYARRHGLTDRESEVLRLILQGKDNQNIASALTIAPSTVKVYVHRLLQKTGRENRQALIQDFWRSA